MNAADDLSDKIGVVGACQELGVPRSSWYRARRQDPPTECKPRSRPDRTLSQEEEDTVLELLNSDRFMDLTPREVYATLLDEGEYYCSWRTMYRILGKHKQVKERRRQRQHPTYTRPELLATGPNQVWSWDISKLRGPKPWSYYYLYVIIDIYSRYVVGWMIADCESSALAEKLIAETCAKQGIEPGQLTIHADRGSSMRSYPVAKLLADLGITKTHTRPYCPDDNPFSEAHFKTLKYRPDYPNRFASLDEAHDWAKQFFAWYNRLHHHTGIILLTPCMVHHGHAQAVLDKRQQILQAAYDAHPERFVKGPPKAPNLPKEVWINPPSSP